MSYYDALAAKWATLSGSADEKLSAINALTIAGGAKNVPVGEVVGYLALHGLLPGIEAFASTPPQGADTQIVGAAKALITLIATPSISVFQTSDPAQYAIIETLLGGLASAGLLAASDSQALLSLAATSLPWWQATVVQGGGGLTSPVGVGDLSAAGLS